MNGIINYILILGTFFYLNISNAQEAVLCNYEFKIKTEYYESIYKSSLYFTNQESKFEIEYNFDNIISKESVYYNYSRPFFYLKFDDYKNLVVIDSIKDLNWILLDEEKEINSYKCKKAITTFRGRTYIAWYTEEVPCKSGPYKFTGLPGLIFYITDNKNVSFELKSLKKIDKYNFGFMSNTVKENTLTLKDFENKKRKDFEDSVEKHKATLPREVESSEVIMNIDGKIELKYEWE